VIDVDGAVRVLFSLASEAEKLFTGSKSQFWAGKILPARLLVPRQRNTRRVEIFPAQSDSAIWICMEGNNTEVYVVAICSVSALITAGHDVILIFMKYFSSLSYQ
jgi:hypothetical protein